MRSMSDLAGALLLRAGVITNEHLSMAARIKERDGGSLGECLIRIGAVEEDTASFVEAKQLAGGHGAGETDAVAFVAIHDVRSNCQVFLPHNPHLQQGALKATAYQTEEFAVEAPGRFGFDDAEPRLQNAQLDF